MSQRSKAEIIEDIKGSFDHGTLTLIRELLVCVVSEKRYDNDVAIADALFKNQGAIFCCYDIAKSIGINLDNNDVTSDEG